MRLTEKIYCRVFQQCMHIAIPFLPYRSPHILHDVYEVPKVLRKHHRTRVLLITDPGVHHLGLTRHLEEALVQKDIPCVIYDQTVANPTSDNVDEALTLYHKHGCDCLIGFGGGSSIDCAKAVGARIARPRKKLSDMEGILKVLLPTPLMIAVPTTAGTGSETTLASVIVDSETRHKYPINDFPLIPDYALLDPQVTESLPPFLTATTGLDALTHAVEAFIGQSTIPATRKNALKAVELIFANLPKAVADGHNLSARKNMLLASYLAGAAFTKSYVGYVHGVAHSLGGAYNVPHGLANAILLPMVLRDYGPVIHKKLKRLAIAARLADESTPAAEAAEAFISAIEEMKRTFFIPDIVPELLREDIPDLAKKAARESNPLYPVPILWDARELEHLYERILSERNPKGGNEA